MNNCKRTVTSLRAARGVTFVESRCDLAVRPPWPREEGWPGHTARCGDTTAGPLLARTPPATTASGRADDSAALRPCGVDHSVVVIGLAARSSRTRHGRPTLPLRDRIDDVTELNGSQGWGDLDIISSAGDLNRFFRALMRGRLLPPRQLKAMKTTVDNPDFPGASYGLGIERVTMGCGVSLWYHDGGMVGWISLVSTTEDGGHQFQLQR
ncbi:serine hydrolase [Spirillospora sp. NPDC048911]|uniref:serine hydrolase n=1 Tax=Spirillospora sp. NPDC048911 TaxID=3364527 RepID=UPI00370FBADB